jgi:PII-like signaling protein
MNRLRLTVFVSDDEQWHHHSLYTEIVHRAHAAGLAGATVLRGVEGFGASSQIHTTRILSLTGQLPVLVVIVDREEAIREFVPQLRELTGIAMATLEPVEVVLP